MNVARQYGETTALSEANSPSENAAAIEAGQELCSLAMGPITLDNGIPFHLIPTGYNRQSLERYLPTPIRRRAHVTINDAASFIAYVTRFMDARTLVFADLAGRKFEAVLDYHAGGEDGAPAWGEHRAALTCKTTPDWQAWIGADKKAMNQVAFAHFIETNLPCIADPAGADLLTMVLFFEAHKSASFRQATRLQNGETKLTYEETIQQGGVSGTKPGQQQIPEKLTLAIEPFEGAGRYPVEAYLRYRINEGQLTLWIELVRPEDVLRQAFDKIRADVTDGVKPALVLAGEPPAIGLGNQRD